MEVTRRRILGLSAALGILGAVNLVQTRSWAPVRSERWMEASLPTEVAGIRMRHGRDDLQQSYRAPDAAYRMLHPYGIVCRVFGTRKRAYDTLVVAGNSLDAFHDPNICFPLGGWPILGSHLARAATRTRGTVPFTVLALKGPEGVQLTAFCYRSLAGMRPTLPDLRWAWFLGELQGEHAQEGAFYRFVQIRGAADERALLDFAASYLDATSTADGGPL